MINLTNGKYIQKKRLTTGAHKIKPRQRHDMLVGLVTDKKMTPINISESLNISLLTIRRDILELLEEGRIIDTSESRERLVTAA